MDLEDPALDNRSWPWLQALILGLFDVDSRLKQALTSPAPPQ